MMRKCTPPKSGLAVTLVAVAWEKSSVMRGTSWVGWQVKQWLPYSPQRSSVDIIR
jgi:hypothetical protein